MPIDYCNILEGAYGVVPRRLSNAPGGQLAEAEDGQVYIIKQSKISGEKILCAYVATEHLAANGLFEAQRFIKSESGLPFAISGGSLFTLSLKPKGRECVLEDNDDLAVASRLLAKMHIAAEGFTGEFAEKSLAEFASYAEQNHGSEGEAPDDNDSDPEEGRLRFKSDLGKTPEVFRRRLSELKRFRKAAKKRREPFDYEYSGIADYYCDAAERVCEELEASGFEEVAARYEKAGCLCHREYTAHNILLDQGTGAGILGFDSVCIEMPAYDLANFIRRRMRKCGWSAPDAEFIVKNYDNIKTITPEEQQILRLLLQFPQKLWRIANKYYNSRRVWCEKSCLAKLQEIKQEKEPLAEFSKHFLV